MEGMTCLKKGIGRAEMELVGGLLQEACGGSPVVHWNSQT